MSEAARSGESPLDEAMQRLDTAVASHPGSHELLTHVRERVGFYNHWWLDLGGTDGARENDTRTVLQLFDMWHADLVTEQPAVLAQLTAEAPELTAWVKDLPRSFGAARGFSDAELDALDRQAQQEAAEYYEAQAEAEAAPRRYVEGLLAGAVDLGDVRVVPNRPS